MVKRFSGVCVGGPWEGEHRESDSPTIEGLGEPDEDLLRWPAIRYRWDGERRAWMYEPDPGPDRSEPPRASQVEKADFARVEKAEIPPNQVTRD